MSDPNYELLEASKRAKSFLDQLSKRYSFTMDQVDEIRHDLGVAIGVVDSILEKDAVFPEPEFIQKMCFNNDGSRFIVKSRNPNWQGGAANE